MMKNIPVICLTDRYWDTTSKKFLGTEKAGTLVAISVQSGGEDNGKLVPVGVVLFSDNTLESVPLEFIHKNTDEI